MKKNAALLRFLAFLLLDHTFGVLRGEQPLRRGSLPRNSETFFATFFGHKKGRPNDKMPLYRGVRRMVAEHRKPPPSSKKSPQSAAFIKAYPSGSSRLNATLSR